MSDKIKYGGKMKVRIIQILLLTSLFSFSTVECIQNQVPVLLRKDSNQVLGIKISGGKTLNSITLSTKGTTNLTDIEEVKIFSTGEKDKFATSNQFGKTLSAKKELTFKGSAALSDKDNWFWVSVKLKPNAKITNRIDFSCLSTVIDGKKSRPNKRSPRNSLRIGVALCNSGDGGSRGFRIPGLVTTNKGTLLAIYDLRFTGRRDLQGHMDIGLSRSTDGGQTWEPHKSIIDMKEWGGLAENMNGVSDACILVDRKTNTIFCAGLWMHGLRDKEGKFIEGVKTGWQHQWHGTGSTPGLDPKQTCQFMMVKSTDDGKTWSEPINLTEMIKKPEWYLFAPAPGNGITMKNGTLVMPTQGRDKNGHPFSNFIYSEDRGKTWKTSEPAKSNTTECAIVELSDGSLMLNMRDNRNYWGSKEFPESGRSVCVTKNMGKTWKEHATSRKALPEPVCMASLIRHNYRKRTPKGLPNEVLFFSNPPQKTKKGGRHNMTIKMSVDDGNIWPEKWHLLLDQFGGGYSSLTSIGSGFLGILYEGSGSQLVFQRINIREILHQGKKK